MFFEEVGAKIKFASPLAVHQRMIRHSRLTLLYSDVLFAIDLLPLASFMSKEEGLITTLLRMCVKIILYKVLLFLGNPGRNLFPCCRSSSLMTRSTGALASLTLTALLAPLIRFTGLDLGSPMLLQPIFFYCDTGLLRCHSQLDFDSLTQRHGKDP